MIRPEGNPYYLSVINIWDLDFWTRIPLFLFWLPSTKRHKRNQILVRTSAKNSSIHSEILLFLFLIIFWNLPKLLSYPFHAIMHTYPCICTHTHTHTYILCQCLYTYAFIQVCSHLQTHTYIYIKPIDMYTPTNIYIIAPKYIFPTSPKARRNMKSFDCEEPCKNSNSCLVS